MTDPQWVNYYNAAISAGQTPQQASAYADSQLQARADKGAAYKQHWQNNKQNAQNVNPATDKLYSGMRNEQVNSYNKGMRDKAFVDTLHKVGETTSNVYDTVKPYVQKGAAILAPTMLESTRKALKPMSTHYASQFMQDKAKNLQNKAAQTEADAQKNQQIANRDYKQASAEEAITAGSATAMNTTAQMSGASGAAAAALAGQNAGNQATNNQYQSAIARNQGRSDERRDVAAKQRRTASDDRQMATQRMQDAATLDMTQREQDDYNKQSRDLSLGNDTEPDNGITQNIIDNIYWRR